MKPNRLRCLLGWSCSAVVLALVLQSSPAARAALGDDVAAVATDQARLHASVQVWRKSNYDIHELDSPTGIRIRHYVDGNGKIFAVSWSGGWRPNLRDIMGVYYDKFIAATRGKRIARGVARIVLPGMVVVMGGHQRALFGHVYLTDLLPAGFSSGDVSQGSHE